MTMSLRIGLPLAAYFVLFLAARKNAGLRAAVLDAAVLWGVATFAITETLSLLHALTATGLACGWTVVALGAAVWRLWPWRPQGSGSDPSRAPLDDLEIALLAGILAFLAIVGVNALMAPPNSTDVLTYHLPRIVHWLDNRSVAFYSTHELRQLNMPPWAEYAILQFHGLAGGDRFDNLVQWFAFFASALVVSLIAGLLGAGVRGQVLAAVFSATLPQGLLEASGSMNECVTGFWLVAMVYYLLRFARQPCARDALGAGATLGLACLTKSTVFVLAPPLALAAMAPAFPWRPRGAWIRGLAAAGLLALVLNVPHGVRNYRLFHSPLGPVQQTGEPYKYTIDHPGPGPFLSGVLRNASLHFSTPSGRVNRVIEHGIARVLRAVGQNVNDPATTWTGTEFHVPLATVQESVAGNPLHAVLLLAVCILLAWRWRTDEKHPLLWLAVGLAAAFLLFCAVLKWSPWEARKHLPVFLVGMAVCGTALARRWPRAAVVAAVFLLVAGTPDVFMNQSRALIGGLGWNALLLPRQDLYFAELGGAMRDSYLLAAQSTATCEEVGLDLTWERNEYPLDALLRAAHPGLPIRNIFVANESRVYDPAPDRPAPCIICPACRLRLPEWTERERLYRWTRRFGDVAVLNDPIFGHPSANNVCTTEFSGWDPWESSGSEWWRWTSGKGVIEVKAAQPLDAEMEVLIYPARYPDEVRVTVNGEPKPSMHLNSVQDVLLAGVPVKLRQGANRFEFVSANPPVSGGPNDPRMLAMMIKRFVLHTGGPATCDVYHN